MLWLLTGHNPRMRATTHYTSEAGLVCWSVVGSRGLSGVLASREKQSMRYLLAFLLPPLAVLLCGKPTQAILNMFLCCFFWVPGVIHAILVVNSHLADKRTDRLVRAMRKHR
jgi:uncharacterized membrane protein YqaE (UPF0057 family)